MNFKEIPINYKEIGTANKKLINNVDKEKTVWKPTALFQPKKVLDGKRETKIADVFRFIL